LIVLEYGGIDWRGRGACRLPAKEHGHEIDGPFYRGQFAGHEGHCRSFSRSLRSGSVVRKIHKIRLSIENPELFLVANEETSLTNIGLAANSRLFISEQFELPEGESRLIVLDFYGVKVNQLGNGYFQLTPKLDVDVSVEAANVALTGPVTAVSDTSLTLTTEEQGDVTVIITLDTVVADSDKNTLTIQEVLVEDNVTVNAGITVDGLDGDVTATSVTVNLPVPAES
jgi:hypothetical protein